MANITEDELAVRFVDQHAGLRWVQGWQAWMVWDADVWRKDTTLALFDAVRGFLRASAPSAAGTGSAALVAAVERLARSDRRVAAKVDEWDNDPWLLNTPTGLVDLRTGEIGPHRQSAFCTLMTRCAVAAAADCPDWLRFLHDITCGDSSFVDYLQCVLGYCLTGKTSEHALFFLHGTGGNGKSTLLDVVVGLLGDYAKSAPEHLFMESHIDRHPTELAMLRGARLVTSAETERGRKWAESRIKALTGGDPVTARFMRQDFFTYTPSFKLAVVGNYKPRLVSVDAAMRRRLQLIPFEAKFDGAGVVRDMPEVLRLEWPGILRWLLNGCLRWQKQGGLGLPERVRTATEQYFTDQDVVGAWRAQCCESGPDYWASPSALYRSWGEFARAAEHPVGSQSSFNEQLESAGFRQSRDHSRGRHWKGIRLRSIGDSDAP